MKYYKYLDLEYELVCDKIRNYVINDIGVPDVFWTQIDKEDILLKIPDLEKMFRPLGLHIYKIAILTAPNPLSTGPIHVDACDAKVRINLPILNCNDTVTNFFQTMGDPVKKQLPNNVPFYGFEPEQCTLVDSFCLSRPAAIRIGSPHQIRVLSNAVPRISCTIEFEENIEYLLD